MPLDGGAGRVVGIIGHDPGAAPHDRPGVGAHRAHRLRRPAAHIALLRKLCVGGSRVVERPRVRRGIAAVNLLPGPASTQLAIFCAWRLRRSIGALVGGLCFILPGLVVILALSVLFFAAHPPPSSRGSRPG